MRKNNQSFHEIDQKYYLQTFKRYPIALEKGIGSKVWDVEGNEYIDALAGIAVNSLGHGHPAVVEAIREQAGKLIHISNFYLSGPQVDLSKKLVELSELDRVFITNSGAESVEGAIKIARKYAHSKGKGGTVISMENCFHGRTLATVAAGPEKMQKGFEPVPGGFIKVPFNDFTTLANVITDDIAAIIIELIQGEGGVNMVDYDYLHQLRKLCDAKDIVLIFDEIQTGIGRTGKWFAKDHFLIQPDIMTLAKGLGGGVSIGAILSNEKVSRAIEFGDHGTTFGGNPLVCAAALAVLQTIENENLVKEARMKGKWFSEEIGKLGLPSLRRIKGKGLMIGLEFEFDTKPLVLEMLKQGVLANATAGNILRLLPALNISYEELGRVAVVIESSLKKIKEHA